MASSHQQGSRSQSAQRPGPPAVSGYGVRAPPPLAPPRHRSSSYYTAERGDEQEHQGPVPPADYEHQTWSNRPASKTRGRGGRPEQHQPRQEQHHSWSNMTREEEQTYGEPRYEGGYQEFGARGWVGDQRVASGYQDPYETLPPPAAEVFPKFQAHFPPPLYASQPPTLPPAPTGDAGVRVAEAWQQALSPPPAPQIGSIQESRDPRKRARQGSGEQRPPAPVERPPAPVERPPAPVERPPAAPVRAPLNIANVSSPGRGEGPVSGPVLGVRRDIYASSNGSTSPASSLSYHRPEATPGQDPGAGGSGQQEVKYAESDSFGSQSKLPDSTVIDVEGEEAKGPGKEHVKVAEGAGGSYHCTFCPTPGTVSLAEKISHQVGNCHANNRFS